MDRGKFAIIETNLGKGVLVYNRPTLPELQQYCREQVDTLWDEVKRFENPHNYYVDLSQKLWDIKQDLLHKGVN